MNLILKYISAFLLTRDIIKWLINYNVYKVTAKMINLTSRRCGERVVV